MFRNRKRLIALSIIPQFLVICVLSYFPNFIETYYSNGIYLWISKASRFLLGWIPFSVGDIIYALLIIYAIRWLFKNRKRFIRDTKKWFTDVFFVLSIQYFIFHLLWGMNYYRIPIGEQMNISGDYTTEQLIAATNTLISKTNTLQLKITKNDTAKVIFPYDKSVVIDNPCRGLDSLKKYLPNLNYESAKIKSSLFSLPLTYMGFSGYLNPFTNEAQIDDLIPAINFPTTISHEISHQLGYAAEDEANFIGFLATIHYNDIYYQYAGYSFAVKHCLNELYERDENLFNTALAKINKGVLKKYKDSREFWEDYQTPIEPLFKLFYDAFLKANAQDEGLDSYDDAVTLIVNYTIL